MMSSSPRVSIGLPVYNGEPFLKEAIDSILAQTFHDFELIISDNASTDGTGTICRAYAAKDKRIQYYRNKTNVGAAKNFNCTFEMSSGVYFNWTAHDDVYAPTFLDRCVAILDQDPSVILCYPAEIGIDAEGRLLGRRPYSVDTGTTNTYERFCNLTSISRGSPPIFGVIRSNVLKKTHLIGSYYSADLVLLAELALYGPLHCVPEDLLFHREHSQRSVYMHPDRHTATGWWDSTREGGIVFPIWKLFVEYLRSIQRAPLSLSDRIYCCLYMMKWMRWRWREARDDLTFIVRHILSYFTSQKGLT